LDTVKNNKKEKRKRLLAQICYDGDVTWIWKNEKALAMIQEGIKEAAPGRHATPPNLAAAAKLARKIKDHPSNPRSRR
jgi:predicted transcriptional regulator